jgi:hypothetical protein
MGLSDIFLGENQNVMNLGKKFHFRCFFSKSLPDGNIDLLGKLMVKNVLTRISQGYPGLLFLMRF